MVCDLLFLLGLTSFLAHVLLDNFIVQVLRPPYGVLYVAAKKHYYGLGGGTRQLKALVDEDGMFLP